MFLALQFGQPKAMYRAKTVVYEVVNALEITMSSFILKDGTFLVWASHAGLEAIQAAVNQVMRETMFSRSPHDTIRMLDHIPSDTEGHLENFSNFLPCNSPEKAQAMVQKVRTLIPIGTQHWDVTICRTNSVKITGDQLGDIENLMNGMDEVTHADKHIAS